MRKHYHTLILAGLFVSTTWLAHGQADCSQALIQAERAYYTGRFNDVETLLAGCIASGFNRDQKTEAYKLVALSSIFTKKFDQADTALMLMLKNNPQFEFAPQDPPEFKKRVESFGVHPLIEVAFNIGLIQPFYKVTDVYNARGLPANVTYKGKPGADVGLSIAYYLNKKISVRLGYEYQRYLFTVQNKDDVTNAKLTESQSRSQWQASAGYKFNFKQLNIQLYGGVAYNTLHTSDAFLVMQRADGTGQADYSYSNLPVRAKSEWRPLMELKVNIPQKNNWLLTASFRYEVGLNNVTNVDDRFYSLYHTGIFEWVEDDFKGSYFVVTVGVSKLFYRIKL